MNGSFTRAAHSVVCGRERFAKREAHQRGAVGDLAGGCLELRVGKQDEPGPKRRTVGFVREADLRLSGKRREHQNRGEGDEDSRHARTV